MTPSKEAEYPTEKPPQDRTPLENRFWEKVDVRNTDKCWWWQASTSSGYSMISIDNIPRQAHRVVYLFSHSDIRTLKNLPGDVVRHKCHNIQCVNPSHLIPGWHSDNTMDSVYAGTADQRFTPEEIREIRALAGEVSQYDLADRFGGPLKP